MYVNCSVNLLSWFSLSWRDGRFRHFYFLSNSIRIYQTYYPRLILIPPSNWRLATYVGSAAVKHVEGVVWRVPCNVAGTTWKTLLGSSSCQHVPIASLSRRTLPNKRRGSVRSILLPLSCCSHIGLQTISLVDWRSDCARGHFFCVCQCAEIRISISIYYAVCSDAIVRCCYLALLLRFVIDSL